MACMTRELVGEAALADPRLAAYQVQGTASATRLIERADQGRELDLASDEVTAAVDGRSGCVCHGRRSSFKYGRGCRSRLGAGTRYQLCRPQIAMFRPV
jgi:hypothetical protein